MKKINEIFHSLQGEGFHTGTAAVFVRFSGCNLSCPFCDTNHSSGKMMSDDDIVSEIVRIRHGATLIILTGGEPSLFVDDILLEKIHAIESGIVIAIETNGTHPLPEGIDFVTLSPKDQFVENVEVVLAKCSELKLVYPGSDPSRYCHIVCEHRFLQPCDSGNPRVNRANMAATVAYIKEHPQWRMSLQTHKILNID